ncbi:uncharacterized protein LOC34618997 [Cyclospora cayetanensis]|uniref:subtilisin n=1 Tax=Cyclospora cayetanensis TaxID=88456 RepID=A0A6P6RQA6_9EIME|nr:uncharacterized protein LOC34618997 [Cyclospora cayetanensis]
MGSPITRAGRWVILAAFVFVLHGSFTAFGTLRDERASEVLHASHRPTLEFASHEASPASSGVGKESLRVGRPVLLDGGASDGAFIQQKSASSASPKADDATSFLRDPAGPTGPRLSVESTASAQSAAEVTNSVMAGQTLHSGERVQIVSRHIVADVGPAEANEASAFLAGEADSSNSKSVSTVWSWNPSGSTESPESEDLKHSGPPKDFEELPLLDKHAEEQTRAEEAAQGSVAEAAEELSTASESEATGQEQSGAAGTSISTVSALGSSHEGSSGVNDSGESRYIRGYPEYFYRKLRSSLGYRHPTNPEHRSATYPRHRYFGSRYVGTPLDDGDGSSYTPSGNNTMRGVDGGSMSSGNPSGSRPARSRFYTTPEEGSVSDQVETPPVNPYGRGWLPSDVVDIYTGTLLGNPQARTVSEKKSQCIHTVGGVTVDATYLDYSCTGVINLAYSEKASKFLTRRLQLQNTTNEPLTVVIKTVNAKVPLQQCNHGPYSVLQQRGGPASFLQGASKEEGAAAAKVYIEDILHEIQRHNRKEPDAPIDLVVSFASPLDSPQTAAGGTSFMQTKEGAESIKHLCDELLSVLEDGTNYMCEILWAVDMIILQLPPHADFSEGSGVHRMLNRLLELHGDRIVFWELSKSMSLQMVPVDQDLPEPPLPPFQRPIFLQAKEALQEQCSAKATARAHLLSGDSPVSSRIPGDPDLEDKLWGIYAARCVHAWMHGEKGSKDVVVAVVDSGISRHLDLDANAWHNRGEVVDGKDNDGNGFVDDVNGWNFATDSNHILDANGHGTHVAGTIGGVANEEAIVGCSPHVSLMNVQQFDASGKGSLGSGVRGISYALLGGAHVVNNSWGSTETSASLELIIQRAMCMRKGLGSLIVNAAGNSSSNNDLLPYFPAGIDYKHTISVGAYNSDGDLSPFSNYGKKSVTLLAPGERVYSTYLNQDYEYLSGTSMAAPHVSGVAALVYGVFAKANSEVTAAEVKDIILATLQQLEAAKETTQYGGAPDAMAAVLMARMGGMWCQMKCTDMIVDLDAGEKYAPSVYIRGYAEGMYTADIQVEVYKSGQLQASTRIPLSLNSSTSPQENSPTDGVAATAFSSDAKERDHSNPLCDVQLKYTGTLGGTEWSAMAIAAVTLGAITVLLLKAPKKVVKVLEDDKEDTSIGLLREKSIPRVESDMFAVDSPPGGELDSQHAEALE